MSSLMAGLGRVGAAQSQLLPKPSTSQTPHFLNVPFPKPPISQNLPFPKPPISQNPHFPNLPLPKPLIPGVAAALWCLHCPWESPDTFPAWPVQLGMFLAGNGFAGMLQSPQGMAGGSSGQASRLSPALAGGAGGSRLDSISGHIPQVPGCVQGILLPSEPPLTAPAEAVPGGDVENQKHRRLGRLLLSIIIIIITTIIIIIIFEYLLISFLFLLLLPISFPSLRESGDPSLPSQGIRAAGIPAGIPGAPGRPGHRLLRAG